MTAETATPFAPFVPPTSNGPFQPAAADPTPAKPERKKRTIGAKKPGRPRATPVRSVAEVKADAVAPKKPGRKQRKPAAAKAPRQMKLDLPVALSIAAGLREADLPLFGHLATTLGTASKKQRPVILAALGKLFA